MKLFFETSSQCAYFLATIPLGFVLAFFLYDGNNGGIVRLIMDLGVLLATGIALVLLLLVFREETLRLYHLLGMATGAVLYWEGAGKLVSFAKYHFRKRKMQKAGRKLDKDEELITNDP